MVEGAGIIRRKVRCPMVCRGTGVDRVPFVGGEGAGSPWVGLKRRYKSCAAQRAPLRRPRKSIYD